MNPPIDMTLRDYFAAKAAQTFVQGASVYDFDALAVDAYRFADSMLKARDTPQAQQGPVGYVLFEGDDVQWTGDPPESGTSLFTTPQAQPRGEATLAREPLTFEEWLAKQHGDPEEIGFLQALRIAYLAGQGSIGQEWTS